MVQTFLIVENIEDWAPYYPAENLKLATNYLLNPEDFRHSLKENEKLKIINLCRSYRYMGIGHYVSLIAQARGHNSIPSIQTLSELNNAKIYAISLELEEIDFFLKKILKGKNPSPTLELSFYFGEALEEEWKELGRYLFSIFPCPILHVEFKFQKNWIISSLRPKGIHELQPHEQDIFALSLDRFAHKIWRKSRSKKKYHYDLAILVNKEEELPPSDKKALQNFIKAGKNQNVYTELIEKKDYSRIGEFDCLFIREETSVNNHTYRFAKKAQSEGLVVIDDPQSIIRCANKIYLENLLQENDLLYPKTILLTKNTLPPLSSLSYPCILKIPDSSFSRGVYKVNDEKEFENLSSQLLKKSALLLMQEYVYTEFDWRIGIFNKRPLFACKYFMSRGHWQIYNHNSKTQKDKVGAYESIPLSKVPKTILQAATKAANLIGDGLYGVDLKEKNSMAYVIEINDNPNIDEGVEDGILGQELYELIIQEFCRRVEKE